MKRRHPTLPLRPKLPSLPIRQLLPPWKHRNQVKRLRGKLQVPKIRKQKLNQTRNWRKALPKQIMLERLQKIIARAGIASRRHAEELIRSGQVRVNGVIVTELGAKADPERDRVEAAGKVAHVSEEHVYILLNKPPEIVSTLADPEGRRTLRNLLVGVSQRVFPVGRLDYAASGAVFLTNDGELASKMLKASPILPQTYWIKVKGRLSEEQIKSLATALRGKIVPLRAPHSAGRTPQIPGTKCKSPESAAICCAGICWRWATGSKK